MDGQTKVFVSEGVPLNSGSTNIILNTGKSTKLKLSTRNSAVIHLKPEQKIAPDFIEINTTLSIASSKKFKLLFLMNIFISIFGVLFSCSVAYCYWSELMALRRQVESLRSEIKENNNNSGIEEHNLLPALLNLPLTKPLDTNIVEPMKDIMEPNNKINVLENKHEETLTKSIDSRSDSLVKNDEATPRKGLLVAQFNGAFMDSNLGSRSVIGPWLLDKGVSSPDSEDAFQLSTNVVLVNEGGVYMFYAQVVYITNAPSCYQIWATKQGVDPRLLTSCTTGDVAVSRDLDRAQMSCAVHTVVRLYPGDTIILEQREKNRTVRLLPGYTYLGFVKISS